MCRVQRNKVSRYHLIMLIILYRINIISSISVGLPTQNRRKEVDFNRDSIMNTCIGKPFCGLNLTEDNFLSLCKHDFEYGSIIQYTSAPYLWSTSDSHYDYCKRSTLLANSDHYSADIMFYMMPSDKSVRSVCYNGFSQQSQFTKSLKRAARKEQENLNLHHRNAFNSIIRIIAAAVLVDKSGVAVPKFRPLPVYIVKVRDEEYVASCWKSLQRPRKRQKTSK